MWIRREHRLARCREGACYRPVVAAGDGRSREIGVGDRQGGHGEVSQRFGEGFDEGLVGIGEVQDVVAKVVDAVGGHQPTEHHLLGPALVLKPRRKTVAGGDIGAREASGGGTRVVELRWHAVKAIDVGVQAFQVGVDDPVAFAVR